MAADRIELTSRMIKGLLPSVKKEDLNESLKEFEIAKHNINFLALIDKSQHEYCHFKTDFLFSDY